MNMSKNRIDKYFSSFESAAKGFSDIEFEKFNPAITQELHQQLLSEYDEEEEYSDESFEAIAENSQFKRLLVTQDNQFLQTLDLWIAHARTRITPSLGRKIESVDGVETFDAFTPYRFRVGIAKLFDSDLVKQKIANLVKESIKKLERPDSEQI